MVHDTAVGVNRPAGRVRICLLESEGDCNTCAAYRDADTEGVERGHQPASWLRGQACRHRRALCERRLGSGIYRWRLWSGVDPALGRLKLLNCSWVVRE